MNIVVKYKLSGLESFVPANYAQSITYTDEKGNAEGEIDQVEIKAAPIVGIPPKGHNFDLLLGYKESGLVNMGSFIVDEVEIEDGAGGNSIDIKGRGSDFVNISKERLNKSYSDISFNDLVGIVAGRCSLTPKIKAKNKISYKHQSQTNETDYSFIQRLAAEQGLEATIKNKYLIITDPTLDQGTVKISYKLMKDIRFKFLGRPDYKGVKAVYYSYPEAKEKEVVVGSAPYFIIKRQFQCPMEASVVAERKYKLLERGIIEGSFGIPGDPTLYSGMEIEIDYLRAPGIYIVNRITHTIESGGYVSQIEVSSKQ